MSNELAQEVAHTLYHDLGATDWSLLQGLEPNEFPSDYQAGKLRLLERKALIELWKSMLKYVHFKMIYDRMTNLCFKTLY